MVKPNQLTKTMGKALTIKYSGRIKYATDLNVGFAEKWIECKYYKS